jgi:large subunit ribosomal protein L32
MVNRMRHTRAHTGNRRSHHALKERVLSLCPECGAPKMTHTMCVNCGKYKGRMVVDVQASLAKKEKKMKERNRERGVSSEKVEAK